MSIDNSLAESAGMTKTINVYTYTGEAEELANGVGSTAGKRGSIGYVGNDYTVKMVQQAFDYQDEDFMKDETIIDNGATFTVLVFCNVSNKAFSSSCFSMLQQ